MKPRFNWRHQYDEERDKKEGELAALRCEDESLTVQSFAKDADLNEIARRYGINAIPTGPLDPAHFRDTTQDPDLRQILDIQRSAKNHFAALPAKLRKRFHNSPEELWAFVNDPENAEEAVRLGLLKKKEPESPASATNPTPTATPANTSKTLEGNAQAKPPEGPPQTSQKGT